MTQSIEAAQAELIPVGNSVSEAEQRSWFTIAEIKDAVVQSILDEPPRRYKFDPRQPISDLAARLLVVSNALHGVR